MKAITALFIFVSMNALASESSVENLSGPDRAILERGKISDLAYFSGAVIGTGGWAVPATIGGGPGLGAQALLYPTFGIGQAIQGRFTDGGWIFTIGETATIAMMAPSAACIDGGCHSQHATLDNAVFLAGFIGYVGFRVWEVLDLWITPPSRNRRYDELTHQTAAVNIAPVLSRNMAGVGLQLSF
jgi:hypothetical protein